MSKTRSLGATAHDHLVPSINRAGHEMAANKTVTADDDDFHQLPLHMPA
jgi:uncharacterized transporter YbjL